MRQVWTKPRRILRWLPARVIAVDLEEHERAAVEATFRDQGWTRATGPTPATRHTLTVRRRSDTRTDKSR